MIHGGPHGQQGPGFNQKAQVYAAHGLRVADGQLSRLDRLRPEARRRDLPGSERRRSQGRARRHRRGAREVPVARCRASRRRRRQLRRSAHQLADHADRSVQGGDSRGRHLEPGELQLHGVLPRLSGRGVRRLSARSRSSRSTKSSGRAAASAADDHGRAVGALAAPLRRHASRRRRCSCTARTTTTCRSPRPSSSSSRSRTSASRRCSSAIRAKGHGIREIKHVEDTITRSLAWYRKYFAGSGTSQER